MKKTVKYLNKLETIQPVLTTSDQLQTSVNTTLPAIRVKRVLVGVTVATASVTWISFNFDTRVIVCENWSTSFLHGSNIFIVQPQVFVEFFVFPNVGQVHGELFIAFALGVFAIGVSASRVACHGATVREGFIVVNRKF